ncbi:hypothetical protein U91I_03450 [alpha proteobacterium U9-1i]|nr:hypothetical protein U91I_03450 [alpha proteobacterium U9-1i]
MVGAQPGSYAARFGDGFANAFTLFARRPALASHDTPQTSVETA